MPIFDPGQMDGSDGAEQAAMKAVKHRMGSRGDVIEVDGKTYQPTGPLDQRGFASLTKNNPDLQQAIAAKGGKHSHQGDSGSVNQQRYHDQDQQLDQQIQAKGGKLRSQSNDNSDSDDGSTTQATAAKGGSKINREEMIQQIMNKKHVDRSVAERVVTRSMR